MKRFGILIAILGLLGVSCGAFEMDEAAVVNGTSISMSEVESLSESPQVKEQARAAGGLVAIDEGRIGGATARSALVLLVQNEIIRSSFDYFDIDAPSEADSALDGESSDPADALFAYQQAMVEAISPEIASMESSPENIEKYYEAHKSYFTQTCFDSFYTSDLESDGLLDDAESTDRFSELLTEYPNEVFISGDGATDACVNAVDLAPELQDVIIGTSVGDIATITTEGPEGTPVRFVVRPTFRGELTLDDARTQQKVMELFQTFASGDLNAWYAIELASADVSVDPRLGGWDTSDAGLVVAPAIPKVAATEDATSALPIP